MNYPSIFYINGEYLNKSQAKISVLDLGLTRGLGVFDFFRTYNGVPFHLSNHLKRFRKSAELLGIPCDIRREDLENIIQKLMKLNNQKEAAVKFILTGGEATHSLLMESTPTFICFILPLLIYPKNYYEEGVKLITLSHTPYLPECKSLNYLPALLSTQKARQENAFEALYVDRNNCILEACTANFFAIKQNTLITPTENILYGITREVILKIAKNHFDIEERDIHYDELIEFDEVFIASSNKEILPVKQIDEHWYRAPGLKTQKLIALFRDYTKNYCQLHSCP
ncbi:MAG: aminotransferase class IV [Chlamydiota bacterium]|jgi:branched-chain amino acid aminotransferase